MKDDSPLDARIHRVRRFLRARLPLQDRITLVRARHRALRRGKGEPAGPSAGSRDTPGGIR